MLTMKRKRKDMQQQILNAAGFDTVNVYSSSTMIYPLYQIALNYLAKELKLDINKTHAKIYQKYKKISTCAIESMNSSSSINENVCALLDSEDEEVRKSAHLQDIPPLHEQVRSSHKSAEPEDQQR